MITEEETLLARTQKELEALKREYNEFAYIVSHDLSAPFRQIEGFANLIVKRYEDTFDEKASRHFDLIVKGSVAGKEIINALLQYSRLNTVEDPFVSVDCNTVIEETVAALDPIISQLSAKIHYNGLPVITAGKKQIQLLFDQLIHNALTFQEKGSTPEISIEAEEKENAWQFRIRDNGIGIRENQIPKIYNVLRRGVNNDDYPGLGMGLALAQKIVRRHGGDIWVETELGSGSTFHFTLEKGLG